MISNLSWIVFNSFIILFLAFDLGVLSRRNQPPTSKQALKFTVFWVFVSLAFGGCIYFYLGAPAFFQYITSYKIEKFLNPNSGLEVSICKS